MEHLLSVDRLSYSAGSTTLLHALSLDVPQHSIVGLIGPNGAGKTTLLKVIAGLYKNPDPAIDGSQSVFFRSHLINRMLPYERAAQGLALLPQQSSLFQAMTVRENLMLVYWYQSFWQGKPEAEFDDEMMGWIERIGLLERLEQVAGTLSGGQKRKLEVVRSILMHPFLLMLDEPFAGVDPKSMYDLKNLLEVVRAERSITLVISDHHVDQLFSMAEYFYVILAGQTVTSGTIHDILSDDTTKTVYLGHDFYDDMVVKFRHRMGHEKKEGNL